MSKPPLVWYAARFDRKAGKVTVTPVSVARAGKRTLVLADGRTLRRELDGPFPCYHLGYIASTEREAFGWVEKSIVECRGIAERWMRDTDVEMAALYASPLFTRRFFPKMPNPGVA